MALNSAAVQECGGESYRESMCIRSLHSGFNDSAVSHELNVGESKYRQSVFKQKHT